MALVILGSRRVTRDFDLLVASDGPPIADLMKILYSRGFELVTKLDVRGDVKKTAKSFALAVAKGTGDRLSFFRRDSGLRIDALIDFPLSARAIHDRAVRVKVESHKIPVASVDDLRKLKEIACKDRKSASDAEDLEFLRKRGSLKS